MAVEVEVEVVDERLGRSGAEVAALFVKRGGQQSAFDKERCRVSGQVKYSFRPTKRPLRGLSKRAFFHFYGCSVCPGNSKTRKPATAYATGFLLTTESQPNYLTFTKTTASVYSAMVSINTKPRIIAV